MIVFSSGDNYVVVTLTEKITLSNSDIIFVFENDTTFDKQACLVGSDLSDDSTIYNEYLITVTDNPTPLNSEVNLQRGDGKYWAYQIADASSFDFDNIDTTGLTELENGKYRYNLTSTTDATYKAVVSQSSIYNG